MTLDLAISAVEGAFLALERGEADLMPVVIGAGFGEGQAWSLKSARDSAGRRIGCKFGSYWPANTAKGLPAHASTVLLLDPETGYVRAVVEASWLTAIRTAAADAVGVKHLARADATTLAIVGAGHQAWHDMAAICRVRAISSILVTARDAARAEAFAARARAEGFPAEPTTLRDALHAADIVATVTPARAPLFDATMIRPGTHISAMGADASGKQELPLELLRDASLFADSVAQATSIGEYEAVVRSGLRRADDIASIGAVIAGRNPGRSRRDEITVFDSSGLAVQDLAICGLAVDRAAREGPGISG